MAKIIIIKNPAKRDKIIKESQELRTALESEGLDNSPLSARVNGFMCVPDLELEEEAGINLDYSFRDQDYVTITRVVHGGGGGNDRKVLSTAIQIVAAVAAVFTAGAGYGVYAALITVAGSLISGAILQGGIKAPNIDDNNKQIESAANVFSISSARNQPRPMEPMMVITGSHRIAPDYASQPYTFYDSQNFEISDSSDPFDYKSSLYGIDLYSANPVTDPDWIVLGTMDIHPGIGAVVPHTAYIRATELTLMRNTSGWDLIGGPPYNSLELSDSKFFNKFAPVGASATQRLLFDPVAGTYRPTTVYLSGGLINRITTNAVLVGAGNGDNWLRTDITNRQDNQDGNDFEDNLGVSPDNDPDNTNTSPFAEWNTDDISSGYLTGDPGQEKFFVSQWSQLAGSYTASGISDQYIAHIFHYGFGDLEVTDTRIKNTPLVDYEGSVGNQQYSDVNGWAIDNEAGTSIHSELSWGNTKVDKGAKLVNEPNGESSPNNVNRRTPEDCYRVEINFTLNGYSQNQATGELVAEILKNNIEWKLATDATFPTANNNDFRVLRLDQNPTMNSAQTMFIDTVNPIQLTFYYEFPTSGQYDIRISKSSLDSDQASRTNASEVIGFNFFVDDLNAYRGENRYSVFLKGTDALQGQIEQVNSLVRSKIWKYDRVSDSYIWDYSRNPADIFLYFALGGFLNPTYTGSGSFPNSPTTNWTVGLHPDNGDKFFGLGYELDCIDLEEIQRWAVYCEDNDLFCDFVFRENSSASEMLNIISQTGRGSVHYYNSTLSIVWEDPEDPVVAAFGMGNIVKGSFKIEYITKDPVYKVVGSYTDRDKEWNTHKVEALTPFSASGIADPLDVVEIVLRGVTEEQQAQREVNIAAARQFYQRKEYSFNLAIEGLVAQRGDVCLLSHDTTNFSHSGRVVEFMVSNNKVAGIDTGCELFDDVAYVTLRNPAGVISTYPVNAVGTVLILDTPLGLSLFSFYLDQRGTENTVSTFPASQPEDFLFFAGPQTVPARKVRIKSIVPNGKDLNEFTVTCVPEDAGVWAYEFNPSPGSADLVPDDVRVKSIVKSASFVDIGGGFVDIIADYSGAVGYMILDDVTSLPIMTEEGFTTTSNLARISLPPGTKTLRLRPFYVSGPYVFEDYLLEVTVG